MTIETIQDLDDQLAANPRLTVTKQDLAKIFDNSVLHNKKNTAIVISSSVGGYAAVYDEGIDVVGTMNFMRVTQKPHYRIEGVGNRQSPDGDVLDKVYRKKSAEHIEWDDVIDAAVTLEHKRIKSLNQAPGVSGTVEVCVSEGPA